MLFLTGDHAQFETLAKAALQKHKSETCVALDQSNTHLKMFAKSVRHWQTRFMRHGNNNRRTLKKLKRCLVKQGRRVRSLKAKQAQQAQCIAKLECCVCTAALEMDQNLVQLATDVKEGQVQHSQLSSEVRANTKAQDLLIRLAGVVDALRTQLQVQLLHSRSILWNSSSWPYPVQVVLGTAIQPSGVLQRHMHLWLSSRKWMYSPHTNRTIFSPIHRA